MIVCSIIQIPKVLLLTLDPYQYEYTTSTGYCSDIEPSSFDIKSVLFIEDWLRLIYSSVHVDLVVFCRKGNSGHTIFLNKM